VRDLVALRRYIAADDPAAAATVAWRIRGVVENLIAMPQMGRRGRVKGTRELVIAGTPFIVAYTVLRGQVVEILAIIHGAQEWPAEF
jgi:plasmid stabilization system protein ParE